MGARGQLTRAHEQREATRRQQDMAREEIQKYYTQQRAVDAASANMMKEDFRGKDRQARQRQAEDELLNNMYKSEKSRELAALRAEEEERLTTTLANQMQEQERSSREIQRLREQSEELRELAKKIRAARVNKERALQLQEKASLAAQEAEYDKAYDTMLMTQDRAGVAAQAAADVARREAGKLGMKALEQQVQERVELQRQAEQEYQRERAMVDEIVRRIQEEDAMEHAMKLQKQAETKEYIANFLKQRDTEVRAQKRAVVEQDKKIQEYWTMVGGIVGVSAVGFSVCWFLVLCEVLVGNVKVRAFLCENVGLL
eukprot:jgi/Chrzof1/3892/Cz13g12110.t1